jgi:hypothetical protein
VSECWAVGNYSTGNAYQTLIEHWDGVAWGIVNSPNVSVAQDNILLAVTCPATSECWAIGYGIDGVAFQTLAAHYTATPPIPTSVVSRKTHGTAGDFDIDLLIGTSRIECRSGGATGDHQVVITFAAPVTLSSANAAPGAGATGSVSRAPIVSGNQVTVNLTNVSNAQTLVINLLGVSDGTNNGDISIPMAVLAGDTTKDRTVNSADIAQTKSQSGQAVTSSNFREDVTVDGTLNSSDIALVKSKSGTALP